jgi:tetratricopeptide (TPR) repeat protein
MAQSQYSLQPGIRIGDYEVLSELGAGSFGITYKAWDHRLQTYVALKEYLPIEFAVRETDTQTVAPRSEKVSHQFQFGLKGFLEEARTLAQFRDARIVRVTNFMEANGTAYLVMDYEEGESLDALMRREQRRLEEPELLRTMIPVLEGLCIVHRAGVLHRDVKPANIYLRAQGSPLLLDFGAARHALGEETQNLTSIVTPGYGPFEQYQRTGKQGPWTDVYGAGATLYRLVTGKRPAEAPDRAGAVHAREKDPNVPAQEAAKGKYTQRLLETIDWMLQPLPQDRPQRVEDALERIASTDAPTLRDPTGPPTSSGARARAALAQLEQRRDARRQWMTTLAAGLVVAASVAGIGVLATRRSDGPPPNTPAASTDPAATAPVAEPQSEGWAEVEAAATADAGDPNAGTGAIAPAPGSREEQIAGALARAQQAVAELRLTTPESDSAMFHFQQVLSLDPENQAARDGVRDIVLRYVSLSDSAAASGNRAQAGTYLERAASISPNDPEVIAARARLAAAPPEPPTRPAPSLRAETRPPREPQPAPAPRWTNFPQVKQAYRAGQISRGEYGRLIDDLERQRDNEIRSTKLDYRAARISRDEYDRRIRSIKLRYAGRQH